MTPTVAIVGRPNVGKSTLFNRLVGKKLALVDDQPGVTRDRREGDARLGDLELPHHRHGRPRGGGARTRCCGRMRAQTEAAIGEADVILFVIDARAGVLPADRPFAELVRRSGKPVILVANKAEGGAGHGRRLRGLLARASASRCRSRPSTARAWPTSSTRSDALSSRRTRGRGRRTRTRAATSKPLQVAIVGRPNAGKSTLINRMIGEDRLLTGPEAGITRDSIALDWDWRGRHDQAVRHRGPAQARPGRGQARKALGRATRCAPCASPRSWSCCSTPRSRSRSRISRSST